jgi:CO/xanthine dehydrogenase Mo-binding subunit
MAKVAAYARQALLELASKKLGTPVSGLSVKDGVVTAGSAKVKYSELVSGQVLNVVMPVAGKTLDFSPGVRITGEPKLKDPTQHKVVGKPYPRLDIPGKVTGNWTYLVDMKLPGMLHARMVRPTTLGSTLVSVGTLDAKKFPTARVLVKNNLVGVVAPNEWEAIGAAQAVAATTKWSDWAGLPGNGNIGKEIRATAVTRNVQRNTGDTAAALLAAKQRVAGSYQTPYHQHAPIGPHVALADVRGDGMIHVWSQTSVAQILRQRVASIMGAPVANVIVHWLDGSSQYGRTSLGGDDATADAVILSSLVGKPVRVQWTRQEDHMWSVKSTPQLHDIEAGLDANGNITAWNHQTWSVPADSRMLGAILAGAPGQNPPAAGGGFAGEWIYPKVPNVTVVGRGAPQFGVTAPNGVGLRGGILRSPGQYQSTFGLESFMNEVAAAAKADPIEFRRRHMTDERGIGILNAVEAASKWKSRPSPAPGAATTGTKELIGRGVAVAKRSTDGFGGATPDYGTWVAAVAEVAVNPDTGKVRVTKMTIANDSGYVINPSGIRHVLESGTLMEVSKTLHEEVAFDKTKVTSKDWQGYPILTMAEAPALNLVLVRNSPTNRSNAAGEPISNPIAAAIAGAFHDATGKFARRLPLRPENVKAILKA